MTGLWIGNRWWQEDASRSPEFNRLSRKLTTLLAKSDSCRSAAKVRLFCGYRGAAGVVSDRLRAMEGRRLAA